MFGREDYTKAGYTCKTCKADEVWEYESYNFGNMIAECDACGATWDATKVNARAILAEARRGF
jgi:hypothetical protein